MSGRASHHFQNVRPETSQKFQVVLQNPNSTAGSRLGKDPWAFTSAFPFCLRSLQPQELQALKPLCGGFLLPLGSDSQGSLGVSGPCLGCTGEGAGPSSAVAALLEVDANIGLPALLRH